MTTTGLLCQARGSTGAQVQIFFGAPFAPRGYISRISSMPPNMVYVGARLLSLDNLDSPVEFSTGFGIIGSDGRDLADPD